MLKTARRGRAGAINKASRAFGNVRRTCGIVWFFFREYPLAGKAAESGLAGRYATALFDLADEGKALDAVAEDLIALQGAMGASEDMMRLVRSPVLDRDEQWKAMSALLDKMGANDLTKKFLGVVTANRRLFALSGIIRAYLEELASRRGEVTADVVSAHPLSDAQVKALEDSLKKALGGKVAIAPRVDSSILGGLIVKVGSRMIDSSLRTQLQKLKFAMKGAG
jgi:F-type H+-transporting ATPase subunit delta